MEYCIVIEDSQTLMTNDRFLRIIDGIQIERNRWTTDNQKIVISSLNHIPRTLTSLARNTGLGVSSAQKTLKHLIKLGIVQRLGYEYSLTYSNHKEALILVNNLKDRDVGSKQKVGK